MEIRRDDPITPKIEHAVEEIWSGGSLMERYNFLDYHFEQDGAYLRARAYLDDTQEVTLYGPFQKGGPGTKIVAPEAEQAALAYLERRYPVVERL